MPILGNQTRLFLLLEYWLFKGKNENSEFSTIQEQQEDPFSAVEEKWQGAFILQEKMQENTTYWLWKYCMQTHAREQVIP